MTTTMFFMGLVLGFLIALILMSVGVWLEQRRKQFHVDSWLKQWEKNEQKQEQKKPSTKAAHIQRVK